MNPFDQLPKSIKKTIRFIKQDVNNIEHLEYIEKELSKYITERKNELNNNVNNFKK